MDKETQKTVDKRMKEGWIKAALTVEAMAVDEKTAESALKKHVEKMANEKDMLIYSKEFGSIQEVKKPLPNIEKGFSQIVDMEIIAENFDKLVYIVMNYGPSAIEILEPREIKMDMGEAQGVLNTIATIIHRFAAMGAGGLLVTT